jgi:hypothetical protein
MKKRPSKRCVVLRAGREACWGETPPFSHMWNLFLFYLDLAGVYATYEGLENFNHFLCCTIDGMQRRDQCIVDRQRRDAFIIRCSERTQYQFAVYSHQADAGIRAKSVADGLVAFFDGGQQLCGAARAYPRVISERAHGGPLIAGVHRDVEPQLDLIPGESVDLISVTMKSDAPFTVEDRGVYPLLLLSHHGGF